MCNCEIREEILFIIDDKETTLKWLETERKYLPVNNMYLKRIEKLRKDIELLRNRLSVTPECDYECEYKKSKNKTEAYFAEMDAKIAQEEKEHKQALLDIETLKQQMAKLEETISEIKQDLLLKRSKRNAIL